MDDLLVLFGSQSGQAQKLAREAIKRAHREGLRCRIACLNQFAAVPISTETPVLIITSTFGLGAAPLNAQKMEVYLMDPKASTLFQRVPYAVLGLGNSLYPKFCAFSRLVDTQLEAMGAIRLLDRLDADSRKMKERGEQIDVWMEQFWGILAAHRSQVEYHDIEDMDRNPYIVSRAVCTTDEQVQGCSSCLLAIGLPTCVEAHPTTLPTSESQFKLSPWFQDCIDVAVMKAEYITSPTSEKRVIHVELDITGSGFTYEPGDAIGVPCRNDMTLVTRILNRLRVHEEWVYEITHHEPHHRIQGRQVFEHLPNRATARFILTCCCDIAGELDTTLLREMAKYASDAAEEEKLRLLALRGDEYEAFTASYPTLFDVLVAFPSCQPPFEALVEYLPPLSPRYYSITSSPLSHPNAVHIAFSVVEKLTPSGSHIFRGVCTSFLERAVQPLLQCNQDACSLSPSIRIPMFLSKSADLRFTEAMDRTVALVGPGTGCAPFRSFLHHAHATSSQAERFLFVGNRSAQDYIYASDWNYFVQHKTLTHLFAAFSRDETTNANYVGDLIREQPSLVLRLLSSDATFFVCGSAAVHQNVLAALLDVIHIHGGKSRQEADALLHSLVESRRIVSEVWN